MNPESIFEILELAHSQKRIVRLTLKSQRQLSVVLNGGLLLRHALERFCEYRGITTGSLASRINALGLPERITAAAHACRHLGNDGVHEGFIYYPKDATYDIVVQMSNLLNLIVEQTIGVEDQTKALIEMHNNRK